MAKYRALALLVAVLSVSGFAAGCGVTGAQKPYLSVVHAQRAGSEVGQRIVLVVEIHNPTRTPLWLRDFDYSLAREGTRDGTRGRVALRETVPPGQTLTVPITVPVTAAAGDAAERFDLKGDLRGSAGDVAMSWKVAALASVGAIAPADAKP